MSNPVGSSVKQFKGLKNDEDSKQIPLEYFNRIKNFNFPKAGLLGMEKILMPKEINQIGTAQIDGIFEYRFLDSNNVLQTQVIAVSDGNIYKDALTTPILLKSGLIPGLVSFVTFNDKLYIANGLNYVQVYDGQKGIVSEMGAPFAELNGAGNLLGSYFYAVTYTTVGGEDILGSVSNIITADNEKVLLTLPIGYDGVTARNIYRTIGDGTILLQLDTVPDNTTLTYSDNIADGSLGAEIADPTNELPKPYQLTVANQKLFGAVVDKYPTQVFISNINIDIWDSAASLDVANYGNDNTPVRGMGNDFGKVIVGTEKNIVIIDPSDYTSNTVTFTRSSVGIKNGYTVRKVPAFQDFPGGLMFVSTLNDVRVMSGLQALPVAASIDNVRTDNWAQNIRGSLENSLKVTTNIYAEFYDYKYHLIINYTKYVFDIRTMGWTFHDISTENYKSKPAVMGLIGNNLYNGQIDGWIEQEYSDVQYKSEDVEAYIESPHIAVENKYKMINKFVLWFVPSKTNDLNINIVTDDNLNYPIDYDFTVKGGVFNTKIFNNSVFLTDLKGMDYRVFNINRMCRWIKYRLTNTVGNISFQGFEIVGQALNNKE
jgi:hypothetical protein